MSASSSNVLKGRAETAKEPERVDVASESAKAQHKDGKNDNIPKKLQELSNDSFERLLEVFVTTPVTLDYVLPNSPDEEEPSPTVSASSSQNNDNLTAKQLAKKFQPKQHTVIAIESEEADHDGGESIEMQEIEPVGDSDIQWYEADESVDTDLNLSVESSNADSDTLVEGKEGAQTDEEKGEICAGGIGGYTVGVDAGTQTIPVKILPADDDSSNQEEIQEVQVEQEGSGTTENGKRGHVVVNLDLTDEDYATSTTPTGHVECYLVIANYLGMSTYRREEYAPLKKGWSWFLKNMYVMLSMTALMQMARLVKNEALYAAIDTDLKSCVLFGNAFLHFLNRCFFVYLIAFCVSKISVMLLRLRQARAFRTDKDGSLQRFSRSATCLGVVSVMLTMVITLFGYAPLSNWTMTQSIQYRSFDFSQSLYIWSIDNYTNMIDNLADEHVEELTMKQVMFGMVESFMDFCATLQGEVIADVLLLAAFMLLNEWKSFEKRIESQILVHPNNCDPSEVEMAVRHFKALRQANKSVNDTLSTVLIFAITQNLFLFGHMFVQILGLKNDKLMMKVIQTILDVLKASAMFFISLQINWRNDTVAEWLRMMTTYNGPVDVEGILGMSVQAALDDVRANPVGFGNDYFLINQTFIVGFCLAVTSIISFLAETQQQQEKQQNQQQATDDLLRIFL